MFLQARRSALTVLLLAAVAALLAGCEMLGIESPEKVAAAREAEGKAIGGACRHAGRAIEDCYTLNKKADKASVFTGWRDMNDYMRENKIDVVAPLIPTQLAAAKLPPKTDDDEAADADAGKKKGGKAAAAKPH